MNMGQSIRTCFNKYVDFNGRARRSEYWWFYLFTIIGSIVFTLLDGTIFGWDAALEYGILSTIFSLGVLLPTLSAAARRLHDTNRSGWWQLLPLAGLGVILLMIPAMIVSDNKGAMIAIPIVLGILITLVLSILLIVWLATDSQPGDNRFGPNPKAYDNDLF